MNSPNSGSYSFQTLGHQTDQDVRKLDSIASTLDSALADAMQLEIRDSELERLIKEAHDRCTFAAVYEDDKLDSYL